MKDFNEMMDTLYAVSAPTPEERLLLDATVRLTMNRLDRKESLEEHVTFLQSQGISIDIKTLNRLENIPKEACDQRLLDQILQLSEQKES